MDKNQAAPYYTEAGKQATINSISFVITMEMNLKKLQKLKEYTATKFIHNLQ